MLHVVRCGAMREAGYTSLNIQTKICINTKQNEEMWDTFLFLVCIHCLILLLSVHYCNTVSSNLGFLASQSHGSESLEILEFIRNGLHLQSGLGVDNWLDDSLELSQSRCILSLLQNNQVGLVCVQTSDIQFQRFVGLVGSAVINGNSDCSGVLGGESSSLELFQSESSSQFCLGRVFLGLAVDDRAQLLDRGRSRSSSLGGTCQTASLLFGSLVQGKSDLEGTTRRRAVLLVEVEIWEDVVVLDHFDGILTEQPGDVIKHKAMRETLQKRQQMSTAWR